MNEPRASVPKGAAPIRCPACAGLVQPPAEKCPHCLADLRTGLKAHAEGGERGGRAGVWLVGGLVLAAVAALAVVFLFGSGAPDSDPPALPPTASAVPPSDIGEALATLDNLAETPGSHLMRPNTVIDKSQDIVDGLNDRQKLQDEVLGTGE